MTVHRWCWTPTRVCAVTARFHGLHQWFSTFSLKGAKSRPTILLESLTKIFNTIQLTRFVLRQNEVCYTKYSAWEPNAALRTGVENHWST